MTPNLDALGHRWVVALAGYNMKLEYLKGSDNKVTDALSWVSTQKLDEETVAKLLNCTRNHSTPRAETANIHVIEEGECVDQEVIVWYTQIVKQHKHFRNLANLDWVEAQSRDPVIPQVIKWISQLRGDHRKLDKYLARVASIYEKHFYAACQKESRITYCICKLLLPIGRIQCQCLSFRLRTGKPPLMVATIVRDTRAATAP